MPATLQGPETGMPALTPGMKRAKERLTPGWLAGLCAPVLLPVQTKGFTVSKNKAQGIIPIVVTEIEAAQAIGMSVGYLRKDRREKRIIPFIKIGDCVRYDLLRVTEAVAALEEGGAHLKPRTRTRSQVAA